MRLRLHQVLRQPAANPTCQIRLRDGTSSLANGRIADARDPRPDPAACHREVPRGPLIVCSPFLNRMQTMMPRGAAHALERAMGASAARDGEAKRTCREPRPGWPRRTSGERAWAAPSGWGELRKDRLNPDPLPQHNRAMDRILSRTFREPVAAGRPADRPPPERP